MTAKTPSKFLSSHRKYPTRIFRAEGTEFIDNFEVNLYTMVEVGDIVDFVLDPDAQSARFSVKLMIHNTFFGYMPAEFAEEYIDSVDKGEKWHGVVKDMYCTCFDVPVWSEKHGWIYISPVFCGYENDSSDSAVD